MSAENSKRCSACGETKPADAFNKSGAGLHSYCRECSRAKSRAYHSANAEKIAANNAARRAANLEKEKAKQAAWYRKNSERAKAAAAKWRTEFPDRARSTCAKWRAANPDTVADIRRRRRAREKGADGAHTAKDIQALHRLQQGKCACCRKALPKHYHVDHIVALSKGGTNDRLNLQLLCPPCNLSKSARDPVEFMQSKGFLL